MSLSGRQQTLLSIYGAVDHVEGKTPKKPQRPSSNSSKSVLQTRKTSSTGVRASSRRLSPFFRSISAEKQVVNAGDGRREEDTQIVQVPKPTDAQCSNVEEENPSLEEQPSMMHQLRVGKREMHAERQERIAAVVPGSKTGNGAAGNETAVISLYGDGFLEVPIGQDRPEDASTECLRSFGSGGFSISMMLFKAADTEKQKAKIEADGARHQNPELDDKGEFVRWLCCGSLNRSIFGCSTGSNGDTKRKALLGRSQGPSESTPKLLAAKLYDGISRREEISFSLYDRGVISTDSEKGMDGGCRVRWRGWECWANNYEVPSNYWVRLRLVFDCRYLQIFFDNELVDCARIQPVETPNSLPTSLRGRQQQIHGAPAWIQAPSSSNSVYIGGHPSHARSVSDWRAKIGFVGLISSFQLWNASGDPHSRERGAKRLQDELLVSISIPEVGCVRDTSRFENVVNAHRNVFWRQHSPPMWTVLPRHASSISGRSPANRGSIVLLGSFYDGAHHDIGVPSPKSFENLLLSVIQAGDIRVVIEYAAEFGIQRSHDHVCRTQVEYEQKSAALVFGIEQMSPLLNVVVNSEAGVGTFEISMEISRAFSKVAVTVVLHSMATTGCFPNLEDVKKNIESVVLFEAKRSPGEEIHIQAFRHLLALAGQSRSNRERVFMESVINRKLVLTERKVAAQFQKIGFFFSSSELPEVVEYLRRIQDNYSHAHSHRMDDLPSLSMLTPTSTGLYKLPFMTTLLFSSTMAKTSSTPKSHWRFVCVLVDHDFQLVDFVHEGCPITKRGGISYRQGQSIYNEVVDRVYLRLTAISSRVFCVLFSLQKIVDDEKEDANCAILSLRNRIPSVRVHLENVEERHVMGIFDVRADQECRWFTLAAAYRSKKNNIWFLQAVGGCGNAASIYASIDDVNALLADLHIIQTYEIRVHFLVIAAEEEDPPAEIRECEQFARRLAKNIRFGRNGRIVLVPLTSDATLSRSPLRITLKLQTVESELDVYTHRNSANRSLPTIQSIYRSLLRILAQHGIKECVQQNPFAAQNNKVKRHVEFRVVSAQTNMPVEKVHIFIEKNIQFDALSSNLAKTVLPTLMMNSRLMSIRRRLQKKRAQDITRDHAIAFVAECISKGVRRAAITTTLNTKIISSIRARALLRKIMRQRYEKIKACILERALKSERARQHSRHYSFRLQRLCANTLVLSESERDLLKNSTQEELALLEQGLHGVTLPTKATTSDDQSILTVWKSELTTEDTPEAISAVSEPGQETVIASNPTNSQTEGTKQPENSTSAITKDRRRLCVTNSEGTASCRLIPGSYSLYVFHLDYFEWTSLAAVYPTITASGLYSGLATSSNSVQEVVIPLEVFRWTYNLQLVDYFHPTNTIKLSGIPLEITDNCSSERQVVTTDENGCATWDICKGLYSVDVLRECSCVLYSGLKQVVVDGGRYRPSKTIAMPVVFGGVKVTLLIASAILIAENLESVENASQAMVCFHSDRPAESFESFAQRSGEATRNPNKDIPATDELSEANVVLGTSKAFKLRLSAYHVDITSTGFSPVSFPVNVTWASSKNQTQDCNRYAVILSPTIHTESTFRVILSYVDGVESMDVIVEVWKDSTMLGHVWRQSSRGYSEHITLEAVNSQEGCEYQSLLVRCQQGFTYKCFVASNFSMTHCLRPQVQIYSSAGLCYQSLGPPSIGGLYWNVCWWDCSGALIPSNSNELPISANSASP